MSYTSTVVTLHGIRSETNGSLSQLDSASARYTISLEQFEAVLDEMIPEVCLTVSKFVDEVDGERVILTFDDGLASDFHVAFPRLNHRGIRATFFVTADNLGRDGYVNAAQLREMAAAGMEIGSHGVTHQYLTVMARHEAAREIRESKLMLEEQLNVGIDSFAAVGGHFSRWMLDVAAKEGYRSFATMIPGRTRRSKGLTIVRRNHLQAHHDSAYISRLLRGDRQTLLANRLRYSLLKLSKRVLGMRRYDRLKARIVSGTRGESRHQRGGGA